MFADDEKGTTARNGILARIPIGRLGEPDDLAGPLLFLASDASSFMTGQVVRPDGGYTAG
jgi:NAD(P)-dependent dehydrogenase (short-subunit alcohol dehydrogenase family)